MADVVLGERLVDHAELSPPPRLLVEAPNQLLDRKFTRDA